MKILSRKFAKDGDGELVLLPQQDEDMWHIYNLISKGDHLKSVTFRKVQTVGNTGSTTSNKVKIKITILVDKTQFDTDTCTLRVSGKNIAESKHIKMGQYHTIELAAHHNFTIWKQQWDAMHIQRIESSCDPAKTAEIAAVVMQPGLAHVCLLTKHMTIVRAKIEISIPKKRAIGHSHDRGVVRFYSAVMEALVRHIDFNVVKVVLLASPGFLKDDFQNYLFSEANKKDMKNILDNKQKFLKCHSANGFKHSLKDVLADPDVTNRIADTKSFEEVKSLQQFFHILNTDPDRALYGYKHCKLANAQSAIDTLLVVDSLFQTVESNIRKEYVKFIESTKDNGGNVFILSALHVSGGQLQQMGGVAAILRFPMPDIAEEDLEDDEFSDSDNQILDSD